MGNLWSRHYTLQTSWTGLIDGPTLLYQWLIIILIATWICNPIISNLFIEISEWDLSMDSVGFDYNKSSLFTRVIDFMFHNLGVYYFTIYGNNPIYLALFIDVANTLCLLAERFVLFLDKILPLLLIYLLNKDIFL